MPYAYTHKSLICLYSDFFFFKSSLIFFVPLGPNQQAEVFASARDSKYIHFQMPTSNVCSLQWYFFLCINYLFLYTKYVLVGWSIIWVG